MIFIEENAIELYDYIIDMMKENENERSIVIYDVYAQLIDEHLIPKIAKILNAEIISTSTLKFKEKLITINYSYSGFNKEVDLFVDIKIN